MSLALSTRDHELLEALTQRVRIISLGQAARSFWGHTATPDENARRRIATLKEAGYVEPVVLLAHPELDLAEPVLRWEPGSPPPNFGAAAYCLKVRWTEKPRPTTAIFATEAAANWLGGSGGRHPRPSEATHDLHLAAVYLRLLRSAPGRARFWQSEAHLLTHRSRGGGRLPDAMIVSPKEKTVIEFGGAYPKRKLADFHRHCAVRRLPYEIW